MSEKTHKYNYEDTKYTELANGSFLVRVQPKLYTNVLNEIVTKIILKTDLYILDMDDRSFFIPYRREVSISREKMGKEEELESSFRELSSTKLLDIMNETIQDALANGHLTKRDKDLLNKWGISKEDAENSLFTSIEIFKLILQRNDFKMSMDVAGVRKDYEIGVDSVSRYLYNRESTHKRRAFKSLRESLGTNNSIPINWCTKDFIQVSKGKTLIRIAVKENYFSSILINNLISKINESTAISAPIVHYAVSDGYVYVNFLCDEVGGYVKKVLNSIVKTIDPSHNLFLIAEITKDFSHTDKDNKEIYCYMVGDEFKSIRTLAKELVGVSVGVGGVEGV